MADFYSNVLGLEVTGREDRRADLVVGPAAWLLHAGPSKVGRRRER